MSLLRDIQSSTIESDQGIGPILLKLRLLAARLGSEPLEEWVKYESEGYPEDVELPDYRRIPVSYRGTFFGSFGSTISDVQISGHLIKEYAGDEWINFPIRQSVAAIDDLIKSSSEGGALQIDASNLILLLQGKVYKEYACNGVVGTVSRASLVEIQHAVRTRILELTIELEKSVPAAAEVGLERPDKPDMASTEKVNQIYNQVIHGNVTSISSYGAGTNITVPIGKDDKSDFVEFLVSKGLPLADVTEFANIVTSEEPGSLEEPLGSKAKKWLVENIKKAADGTWNVSVSVATQLLTEAALKYYGMK